MSEMLIILSMIVPEAQNRKKLECCLPSSLSTLSIIGIVILIINIYIYFSLSVCNANTVIDDCATGTIIHSPPQELG